MVTKLLLVALGGAIGSVLRFLVQRSVNTVFFPYGTFAVNLLGCLLIGIIWGYASRTVLHENYRLLLVAGFCGGFTTFSAFSQESVNLLYNSRWLGFAVYVSLSVFLGIVATFAGYKLSFK